ncbi:hypothetical protein F443_19271 [Phytophthora nicotianae P1569]|uniref:Uncharacterized protein n=1 Tax=Phytophthora nicotianae P1569 TaxID=1317065 RepID=V9E5D3_PHYNI|nr:hypothetical protein F443_19271 [Phytophthora nicotianae P1569]
MNNWWKLSIKEHKEALSEEKNECSQVGALKSWKGIHLSRAGTFFLIQLVFRVSIAFITYF